MHYKGLINRNDLAEYLSIAQGTLAVWECLKRYPLKCKRDGKHAYYAWQDIYRFISIDEDDYRLLLESRDKTPLLDRKRASTIVQASPNTLLNIDRQSKRLLRPRRVGGLVRYRKADLEKYIEDRNKRLLAFYEDQIDPG